MACRTFGLLLPKAQGGEVRRKATGAGQSVFYTSIFIHPQEFAEPSTPEGWSPSRLRHRLLPRPRLCCWQSHAVTSHPLPQEPPPVGSGWPGEGRPRGAPSVQGTECQAWAGGQLLPNHTGQRPVLLPILRRLKCNDDPVPPLPRAASPVTRRSLGRADGEGLGAKLERPAVSSPNTLGDQTHVMVKGLVPRLTASASDRAGGPPTPPCTCSRTGARWLVCTVNSVSWKNSPPAQMFFGKEGKKGFLSSPFL